MSIAEENILMLLQKIAKQMFADDYSEYEDSRLILLEKIRLRNIELHLALNDFILAYESLEFIAADYQLRLKAADIWKMQKDMFVNVLEERTQELVKQANDLNIDINYEINKITQ